MFASLFSLMIESPTRLYQRKPVNNMKYVSAHVSPIYANSVSELVKPLNVSKPVCSNNVTERNVCKVSSVSQLVKPSIVGSSCNGGSVSQLVKSFNVSKLACSSNAINPVICSSTCVSDCHSVKPIRKLIDVNQKCPREQFINKKSSCQHAFIKPFSAVNIIDDVHIFLRIGSFIFMYFVITFAITMLAIFSKVMSGVSIFLQRTF